MRAHRTREYLTTNGQILKTTAAILSASAIFLIAWTAVDPEVTLSDEGFSCRNSWWEISITAGGCAHTSRLIQRGIRTFPPRTFPNGLFPPDEKLYIS